MSFEDLVIIKALNGVADGINDNIENSILNGLAWIVLFAVLAYFLLYVLLLGAFQGHLTRLLLVFGIWLLVEFANMIGGGHNSSHS